MTPMRRVPPGALVLVVALLASAVVGCGSADDGTNSSALTRAAGGTEGAAASGAGTAPSTATAAGKDSPSTAEPPATTPGRSLEGAARSPRSAPADGSGTALLTDARVGFHEGFERIVFEFAGTAHPGYRVRWVDGPILADASGDEVRVDGEAYLEMIMEPASGIDMETGNVTYEGADRIPVADPTALLADLVRTGDFESVLTWVAGATAEVPFRVLSLSSPTRLVIDLQTA